MTSERLFLITIPPQPTNTFLDVKNHPATYPVPKGPAYCGLGILQRYPLMPRVYRRCQNLIGTTCLLAILLCGPTLIQSPPPRSNEILIH